MKPLCFSFLVFVFNLLKLLNAATTCLDEKGNEVDWYKKKFNKGTYFATLSIKINKTCF